MKVVAEGEISFCIRVINDYGKILEGIGIESMKTIKELLSNCIVSRWAVLIAIVHWGISFFTDKLIFRYVWLDFSDGLMALKSIEAIAVKLIFGVLVLFLWQGLFYFVYRCQKRFKILALSYLICMLIFLFLTWPGIWRMDEFGLLSSSVQLFPHWWQNYITSVWYILSLMLFPFPSGVIISQIVIASLLIARIVCNTCDILEHDIDVYKQNKMSNFARNSSQSKPTESMILMLIPFFMLPVIDSNLYPLRMSLYAYLELTLLSEVYFFYKKTSWNKKTEASTEGKQNEMENNWLLAVLAAVVTVWRTEAIYYVVAFPLLLAIIGGLKRFWKMIIVYLIIVAILFVPQKLGEKATSGDQYQLTSVVLPLVPLTLRAIQDGDMAILEDIDQVVDIRVIESAASQGKNGISMFWSEPDFQREYTSEDFARFESAYHKLILRYPDVFLQERLETFLSSTDLLENTTELFVKKDVPNYETFGSYFLSQPISNDLRTKVIKTLEIRKKENYEKKYKVTNFVYTAIPAILFLMIACVFLIIKKKWIPLVILLTALARVPLVFLTAPSRLFMYYYSVYMIGYVVLFYMLARCMYARKKRS